MFLIYIKSKIINIYIYVYKFISDIFGYPKYFGSSQVRFRFFKYQKFKPIRIFNQFWFGFGTNFLDRVRFGSSDPSFLPNPILTIKYLNQRKIYISVIIIDIIRFFLATEF